MSSDKHSSNEHSSNEHSSLAEFVRSLPKAELHVHLEGCLEAELLFEIARRNQVKLPWASAGELRSAYQFDDLQSFLNLYFQGCQVLQCEQDFNDVTRAYLSRAHVDGIVRAEIFLGPQSFTERGVAMADILGGTLRAIAEARHADGISGALLISAHRHRSEADAFALLEAVLPWAQKLGGFGLGGAEANNPPLKFARYFGELRRLGFKTSVHAGEEGPASYVRQAADELQVDRIDHGLAAMADAVLLSELAESQLPLTVCPISNVKLRVVQGLSRHPLAAMLAAGLNVTLNSDDPAYFGAYLGQTYLHCAEAFGLNRKTLAQLAANSIRASYLSEAQQQPHLEQIATLINGQH